MRRVAAPPLPTSPPLPAAFPVRWLDHRALQDPSPPPPAASGNVLTDGSSHAPRAHLDKPRCARYRDVALAKHIKHARVLSARSRSHAVRDCRQTPRTKEGPRVPRARRGTRPSAALTRMPCGTLRTSTLSGSCAASWPSQASLRSVGTTKRAGRTNGRTFGKRNASSRPYRTLRRKLLTRSPTRRATVGSCSSGPVMSQAVSFSGSCTG